MACKPGSFIEGKPWGLTDETVGQLLASRAARDADFPYCRIQDRVVSVGELDEASGRLASNLAALGVGKGHRVALLLNNSVDHIILFFALAKLGACQICINIHLRGDSLSHTLRDADPSFLVAEGEFAEHVSPLLPMLQTRHVIWRHPILPLPGLDLSALLQQENEIAAPAPIDPDEMIAINYTSGTTGLPKGVMLTDRMLRVSGWAAARECGPKDGDVLHMWEPFYHIGGCEVLILAVQKRVTLAMVPKLSVTRLWDEVRQYGVTHIHFLGGVLALLLKQPPSPNDRNHSVRVAWGGGCPERVWRDFEERFGVKIRDSYGMTECSSFATQNLDGMAGSIGQALPYLELTIVDNEGRPLGPNERGEIRIREKVPGILSKGYWRNPQATADTFKDGVLHTGDLASYDERGYFYYQGRKKDSIRRRGENISAAEVERILNQHASVEESAIVGVRNEELADEEVKALIKIRPGNALEPLDLIKWCEERMARFQIPRFVEFIDEFPKTPSERIRKELLSREVDQCWDLERSGYSLKR